MKRLMLTFLFFIFFLPFVKAQRGYTYIDIAAGAMYKEHFVAELSYEWAGRYYNGNEVFLEYARQPTSSIVNLGPDGSLVTFDRPRSENYLVGYAFKPLITRNKNVALNLRLAGSIGTDTDLFLGSLSAGLELNFFTRSGLVVMLREKNQLVFFAGNQWRIGLLAGIKIPLKK